MLEPAGTTTLVGTVAAALLEVNKTLAPVPVAFPERVTVPVPVLPPDRA